MYQPSDRQKTQHTGSWFDPNKTETWVDYEASSIPDQQPSQSQGKDADRRKPDSSAMRVRRPGPASDIECLITVSILLGVSFLLCWLSTKGATTPDTYAEMKEWFYANIFVLFGAYLLLTVTVACFRAAITNRNKE
jgi:hypothetical protein